MEKQWRANAPKLDTCCASRGRQCQTPTLKYQGNLSIQTSLLLHRSMSVTLHNGIWYSSLTRYPSVTSHTHDSDEH